MNSYSMKNAHSDMSCKQKIAHSNDEPNKKVKHDDHEGFLHKGCLHCPHGNHLDEHTFTHDDASCTTGHICNAHEANHQHSDSCGHEMVPHNGHTDYLVNGHLHHVHQGHCDHHGFITESCDAHVNHGHVHGPGCGHQQILHEGHSGYLHHGHLHCPHDDHVDEHVIKVSAQNPSGCHGKADTCQKGNHVHGKTCRHLQIPHGDHADYLVDGELHHTHDGHCDLHGQVKVVFPTHPRHNHAHSKTCGHTAINHENHIDYLHDGHLHHHREDGEYEEHALSISESNPSECTPDHDCASHLKNHFHGPNCGHLAVEHADHFDYLVGNHLHHPHGNHCDHHGQVIVVH